MSDPVARLSAALEGRYAIERELGEGGMATVYLLRGWGGVRVFLVTATLLLSAGCATWGDVRRLQDEVAGQAARQEAQLRELSVDIQALRDSLEIQSAIQSELVVDTRGGIARELRDIRDQLAGSWLESQQDLPRPSCFTSLAGARFRVILNRFRAKNEPLVHAETYRRTSLGSAGWKNGERFCIVVVIGIWREAPNLTQRLARLCNY